MKALLLAAVLLTAGSAMAKDVYVQGHYNSNGTYTEGHHRSSPDASRTNNYSAQGNYNPYTGASGTVNPYTPVQPNYGSPPSQPYQPYGSQHKSNNKYGY